MAHLRASSPSSKPRPTPAVRPVGLSLTEPVLSCLDCGDLFEWSASTDDDRCPGCADSRSWFLGGAA